MALNWTMTNPDGTPVPLPHEMTICTIDSGAELKLTAPADGRGAPAKTLQSSGRVYLTDKRLIFLSRAPPPAPAFDSLSVPLHSVLSTKFEQPTFGANVLRLTIKPAPDGGLTEGTEGELRFKERPMFEFVALLEKTRERAIYMARQTEADDENLPTYTSPSGTSAVSFVGGVPVDNPPGYDA
ncbi:hypothetical protein HDZ31DRAFT_32416 [Schizophyllum fasciatum]